MNIRYKPGDRVRSRIDGTRRGEVVGSDARGFWILVRYDGETEPRKATRGALLPDT
jgi:hypothetical protein